MNDNRIAEIQQRCEAATPSPWEVEKYYHDEPYEQFIKSAAVVSTCEDGSKRTITRNNWSNPVVADLEFIAHAREDIPYLLAQLAERDKEIERLRKEVAPLGYRVPVVRGEWVVTDAYPHRVYCSLCYKTNVPNEEWLYEKNDYPKYCMWCGAKMEDKP